MFETAQARIAVPRSRVVATTVCALVTMLLFLSLASSAAAVSPLPSGVMSSGQNPTSMEEAEMLGHLGATFSRVEIGLAGWGAEPDWNNFDQEVEHAAENGATVLPILVAPTPWPSKEIGKSEEEVAHIQKWERWVKQIVERYEPGGIFWSTHNVPAHPIQTWEVSNEPNNTESHLYLPPARYGEMLGLTGTVIRAISGYRAEVLFGGVYALGSEPPIRGYLETAIRKAGTGSFTGLAIHPYELGGNIEERVSKFKQTIGEVHEMLETDTANGGKQLWITETGQPVKRATESSPEGVYVWAGQQAEYLRKTFTWAVQHMSEYRLGAYIWYDARDTSETGPWQGRCGLRDLSGNERPAFNAFEQVVGMPEWPPTIPPPPNYGIQEEQDDQPGGHAIVQPNGTVDVFYRAANGELGHNWYDTGGLGWLSGNLPGPVAVGSVPHAIVQSNGTIDVFFRTPSGGLGHDWKGSAPGSAWGSGNLPGSLASDPHPVFNSNGTIDVFFKTPNGELGHDWYDTGGLGWLSGSLPGSVASAPYAVEQANGTIDVFYRTAAGGLGHDWLGTGGSWASANLPGSVASAPHPVALANGTVDVFYKTPNGELGHNWYDTGGLGWLQGNLAGPVAGEPHVTEQANGTIDVFFREPNGELGHDWKGSTGPWASGNLPGPVASDPHALVQPNGTIDVFFRTPNDELGHDWYDTGGSGWHSGNLPGAITGDPHISGQTNGTIDVFYRTPSGGLGHDWVGTGAGGWAAAELPGSVAARPPLATTGAAAVTGPTTATVTGTLDPEASLTSDYFEYGTTTSYGSKTPVSEAGSLVGAQPATAALSGLSELTTYHYRLVATSSEGTTYGSDAVYTTGKTEPVAEELKAMAVTEPFNGSTTSLSSFGTSWVAPSWSAGKGQDTTVGWGPTSAYPTINGVYYNAAATDTGPGLATVATVSTLPNNPSRYLSLWIDLSGPTGARNGYELRFTEVSTGSFAATLSRWSAGTQVSLKSISGYALAKGSSIAIVDKGGTVSAWVNASGTFTELMSAADSSFSGGYGAVEGAGNFTRLTNFKFALL